MNHRKINITVVATHCLQYNHLIWLQKRGNFKINNGSVIIRMRIRTPVFVLNYLHVLLHHERYFRTWYQYYQ